MQVEGIIPAEDIDKRNGGCGVIFENKLYVWGGNGTDVRYPYREMNLDDDSSSDSDGSDEEEFDPNLAVKTVVTFPRPKDPNHPFDVLDLSTRTWTRQPTSGSYPTLGLGSSLNVHYPSRSFILFSGLNDVQFDSEVYKVSPDSDWVWEKVQVVSDVKPSNKYLTGVIIHNDRMCIFGGVGKQIREIGDPPRSQDPGGKYHVHVEDYGWTNEYLEFLINSNEWIAPLDKDAFRPPPLGAHAFSKFDSHRAVLFGGNGSLVYSNHSYLFDLDTRVWTGPCSPSGPEHPWPIATRFATLTSLVDPERVWHKTYSGYGPVLEPRMVLLWGKSTTQHISTETWLLEFDLRGPAGPILKWTQLKIGVKPRSWHIARPVYSDKCSGCDVVIFGGNMYKEDSGVERNNAANLKILHFGLSSLVDLCLEVVIAHKELMEMAEHRYPGYKGQISGMFKQQNNCPITRDISVM